MSKTALIIIDVQNDFLPGGALAVPRGDEVIPRVSEILEDLNFDVVVLTQDHHPRGHESFASSHPGAEPFSITQAAYGPQVLWPDHCVIGTRGAEIRLTEDVMSAANVIIRKGTNPRIDSYSAFVENDGVTKTGLSGWLRDRGVDEVVICGLALDYCVAYSALDAAREGFLVTVPLSACRAISQDAAHIRIREMRDAGVNVIGEQK